ncbi:MAG TPA: cell wall hydrolase [Rhizomicrobium sp.]|jgi:spore germination cell wall hydrolase CwlJ-like protein
MDERGLIIAALIGLGLYYWWTTQQPVDDTGGDSVDTGDDGTTGSTSPTPSNATDAQMVLAQTIYGEARGETSDAQQGVANVVMNRVADPFQFPAGLLGVASVCQSPKQFSCWNPGDPNLAVITTVDTSDPVFQQCLNIAQEATQGTLADLTGGATFYHDTSIATPSSWIAAGYVQTVQLDHLVFFRT